MVLPRFANASWRKILSPEPYMYFEIAAARPSKCCVTTASAFICSPAGFRKVAFAGGPKIKTRRSIHWKPSNSRYYCITDCPSRRASPPNGERLIPAPPLRLPAIRMLHLAPHAHSSTADMPPDWRAPRTGCASVSANIPKRSPYSIDMSRSNSVGSLPPTPRARSCRRARSSLTTPRASAPVRRCCCPEGLPRPSEIALVLPSVSTRTGTPGPGYYWAPSGVRQTLPQSICAIPPSPDRCGPDDIRVASGRSFLSLPSRLDRPSRLHRAHGRTHLERLAQSL